jgi:hypothetical protein
MLMVETRATANTPDQPPSITIGISRSATPKAIPIALLCPARSSGDRASHGFDRVSVRVCSEVEKTTGRIITHLFFYPDGPRAGEAIGSFRKAWATACDKAKLPDLRFHDLRQSAAVQMLEAGIPDTHAMSLLGHQTRSIFDRYAISGRDVLRSQVAKLGEHYSRLPEPDRKVVSIGTGS